MTVDLFGPTLAVLLDCATDACAGVLDDPPERAFIATGEIALDDCCSGQVWVRLISVAPSGTQTYGPTQAQPCGVLMWEATIGVGVVRCAAPMGDDGSAPTPDALTADAVTVTADLAALAEAIQCCATERVLRLRMGRWEPVGPMGGCTGGEWVVTVNVDSCPCP